MQRAHVCVVGLGGSGSWVVEGLARSGIGKLTLIDLDDICISNTNRQIQALTSTVGQFKAEALRARVLDINPSCEVNVRLEFLRPEGVKELLAANNFTYMVDAADGVSDKASIIDACVQSGTPVVCSGGVGGLTDPTLIRSNDMARVIGDSLIMHVRKKLRQKYGYPLGLEAKNGKKVDQKWGINVVHTLPTGVRRGTPSSEASSSSSSLRKCDLVFGNAAFSTGTAGFIMSSVVVNEIASNSLTIPKVHPPRVIKSQSGGEKGQKGQKGEKDAERPAKAGSKGGVSGGPHPRSVVSLLGSSTGFSSSSSSSSSPDLDIVDSSSVEMVDAHCHLQLSPLFEQCDEHVRAAIARGVSVAVACGTCPGEDWDRLISLTERYPGFVRPQFGLHPWWISRYAGKATGGTAATQGPCCGEADANSGAGAGAAAGEAAGAAEKGAATVKVDPAWEAELEGLLTRFPAAGVGECGLDKAIKADVPLELQVEIMRRHCEIAERHGRPVTVHCVGCWGRLQEVLREFQTTPVVLHSVNSCPPEVASMIVSSQSNVFFSFTGRSLIPRVRQLIEAVPGDRILLETDSPDQLLPSLKEMHAFNSPMNVRVACREVALLLGVDASALATLCKENALSIFGKKL